MFLVQAEYPLIFEPARCHDCGAYEALIEEEMLRVKAIDGHMLSAAEQMPVRASVCIGSRTRLLTWRSPDLAMARLLADRLRASSIDLLVVRCREE